ncbi:hypothetical protein [Cysteiniphilum sp. 6C5]|uniref:hypothetical protein n=1 Tax=unclassified Cysteiniphilum TaxID=2610889 RepID=UPI003F870BEF
MNDMKTLKVRYFNDSVPNSKGYVVERHKFKEFISNVTEEKSVNDYAKLQIDALSSLGS